MNKLFKSLKLLNDGDLNKVKGGSGELEKPCDDKGFTKNCGLGISFTIAPCLAAEVNCPDRYFLICNDSKFVISCSKKNSVIVNP